MASHVRRSLLRSIFVVCVTGVALLSTSPSRAQQATRAASAASERDGLLPLNAATEAQLEELPGIGPARARAIVELRSKLGGFKRLEQLMRVRGVGRKTFRKLRPLLTLGSHPARKGVRERRPKKRR